MPEPSAPSVLLHLWGVSPWRVPSALSLMATTRRHLPLRTPGLRFRKLLGTGNGRTFTPSDADPLHWALLTVWADDCSAEAFASSHVALRHWNRIASELLVVRLQPIASRGSWSGRQPFGDPAPAQTDGPVASITRARIAPRKAVTFWRSVPAVSHDLHQVDGGRLAIGIGEAPVGLQGTFSLWTSAAALREFAHRRAPHAAAIRRTAVERWYTEELFARFAVRSVTGTYRGRGP